MGQGIYLPVFLSLDSLEGHTEIGDPALVEGTKRLGKG